MSLRMTTVSLPPARLNRKSSAMSSDIGSELHVSAIMILSFVPAVTSIRISMASRELMPVAISSVVMPKLRQTHRQCMLSSMEALSSKGRV